MRVAFVLDCHDREVIGWTTTTAGISGEVIRDMMIECVERRFQAPRAPYRTQWLTNDGSIYAAAKTVDIALALGLDPCFTPVESPESNGMAEAFVKTFKRKRCEDRTLARLRAGFEPRWHPVLAS